VQQTIAVDLALLTSDDARRKDLELALLTTATHPDAQTLSLLHTVPGIGTILRRVWRSDMHRIDRFPRVQACASSCRLVTCRQASGGKRVGTSGTHIGHAHLTWACAEAAPRFLRHTPQGQTLLSRVEKRPDQGNALRILAPTRGRTVYGMRQRQGAFALERVLQSSGSSAGEPGASLDAEGRRLERACAKPSPAASVNAKAGRGPVSLSPGDCLAPHSGACLRGVCSPPVAWAAPPPSPALPGASTTRRQAYGIGRYEGTTSCRGRSGDPPRGAAIVTHVMMAPQDGCGAATFGGARAQKSSQNTPPTAHRASVDMAEKNAHIRSQGWFVS
jgi:Transposase IS116/IS110/IS902 family